MNIPSLPPFLSNIYVVLSCTSHPSNIGSTARAMKTMGLTQLILVAPQLITTPQTPNPPIFIPDDIEHFRLPEECFTLASGATDVLDQVRIVATLPEALVDIHIACALTSRKRELSAPLQTPRQLTPELLKLAQAGQKIALVFGNEKFGLSIEEVALCNRLLTINGNPNYFSLNLSQAVQVVCYEIFSQLDVPLDRLHTPRQGATIDKVQGLIGHFESVMQEVGFFNRRGSNRLMRYVARFITRASPEKEEIDILRGFLKTISNQLKKD